MGGGKTPRPSSPHRVLAVVRDSEIAEGVQPAIDDYSATVLVSPTTMVLADTLNESQSEIVLLDTECKNLDSLLACLKEVAAGRGQTRHPRLIGLVPQLHRSARNRLAALGFLECLELPLSRDRVRLAVNRLSR